MKMFSNSKHKDFSGLSIRIIKYKNMSYVFYKAEEYDYKDSSWNSFWRGLAEEGALTDSEREYVKSLR